MIEIRDTAELAKVLRMAADAHHTFETVQGKPDADWPAWYARFIADHVYVSPQPLAAQLSQGQNITLGDM